MLLLDENYEGFNSIEEGEDITKKHFWLYDLSKHDFFLTTSLIWYNLKSEAYELTIGRHKVMVPANYYILIGDYDVGFDVISPEEVVGRTFQAFTMNSKLSYTTSNFQDFDITGYTEDEKFIFPLTNALVPVKVGSSIILLSSKNVYTKIKNLCFSDFM